MKIQEQPITFHFAGLGEEEALAAADVVRSGWLTMGPKTIEFEQKFAFYAAPSTQSALIPAPRRCTLH
jgi:dTDP-4-amino-4,6-dideoxygalactose transaminase